jgi:hypothetical protein
MHVLYIQMQKFLQIFYSLKSDTKTGHNKYLHIFE